MDALSNILTIGDSLESGDYAKRIRCPKCEAPEKAFQIWRDKEGLLRWKCWRASCGYWGRDSGYADPHLLRKREPRKKEAKPYTGALEPLSDEWRNFLQKQVGWSDRHIQAAGARYAPDVHRVALPVLSPNGTVRGHVLRSYSTVSDKKVMTYKIDVECPFLSWYPCWNESCDYVVVVEDIPSAVRASRYTHAVALLGTHVSEDSALEIAERKKKVVWALDDDATTKAIKWHKEYKLLFSGSTVLHLTRDIKNMKEDELCELLGRFQKV